MIRNKESRTKGKLVPQIRWEIKEDNCQIAAVLVLKVGHYHPKEGRRCGIVLIIHHNDNGWMWSTAVAGMKISRDGIADAFESAQHAATAVLPDIWTELRDYTIRDLRQGEDFPPKEPHF